MKEVPDQSVIVNFGFKKEVEKGAKNSLSQLPHFMAHIQLPLSTEKLLNPVKSQPLHPMLNRLSFSLGSFSRLAL